VPDDARGVRQGCDGVGRARVTIGAVWRRLTPAGEVSRRGQTLGDRRVVWGRVKTPASRGRAAWGKTPQEPRRPRQRAPRGRPLPPRRAVSTRAGPPPAWRTLPGPARVALAVLTAGQEPWWDHHRPARPARRGARSGRHGVVPCPHCGEADDGTRLRPRARTGRPRASADDRCLGTDADRCGGERVCQHTPVRTERLALAVWPDVCALLAHPRRLAAA
jgi:hypothetical protein